MTDTLLACRDCGQMHRAGAALLRLRWLSCRRCGARLWRRAAIGPSGLLAFTATAVILFVLANAFPLFEISLAGDRRSDLIGDGVALAHYGGGIAAVGLLVALISLVIPALSLGLLITVIGRLNAIRPNDGSGRSTAGLWRAVLDLRPWAMLDVYLLAAVVAYTRLDQLAGLRVGLAVGGCALAALVLVQVVIEQSLSHNQVWNAVADPAAFAPDPGEHWILCRKCELVVGVGTPARATIQSCPRCGARLMPRRSASLAATAAFTAAGYILYLPANLLPVLTITRIGRTDPYTILGGVRELATAGLWPLALLVLVASILVPAIKLVGLTWFLIAIRLRTARLLRQRTVLYRFIGFIGRWSNIDVFVVSILAALVQFGNLTRIEPGPGISCFAAVVVATMIAARVFDPRLMWDAAVAGRPR